MPEHSGLNGEALSPGRRAEASPEPFRRSAASPDVRPLGAEVLVLSPCPTSPTDQGNRKRIHAVCTELKRRGVRVHYVFFPQEWWFDFLPHDLVRQMGAEWDSFHLLPTTRHAYRQPAGADYLIDEWWDESIGVYLKWLFKRQKFDACIVNYAYLSKAFEFVPQGTLKILDTHDQFTGRRQLQLSNGLTPEFFYTTAEEEAIALNRADLVWAIKDEEADFYRSISKTPCITMPHVEPEQQVLRHRRAQDEGKLVVGMLGSANAINVSNALAFVEVALPVLRASLTPVVIRFVGAMCSRLSALEGLPGVELRGPVDTVDEFYRDVDLVIVPLAFSTGLKIKAVEAFAMGMPMVAMGHALEGIPTHHPLHDCQSMAEVAEACCRVAAEPALLDELRASTRETYALVQRQAKQAFDHSLHRVASRPTVIVTLDRAFFDPDSLYREHAFQTINLLQQLRQVVLYVDQPLPSHQSVLFSAFHGLAASCRLVISPEAEGSGHRSHGLSSTVASLATLLESHDVAILWVLRLCPELRLQAPSALRRKVFIRTDALEMLAPAADVEPGALLQLTDRCGDVTLVSCQEAAHTAASLKSHKPLLTVPFWRWKPGKIGERGRPTPDVLLLARHDQAELGLTLVSELNELHAGQFRWQLVLPTEPLTEAAHWQTRLSALSQTPTAVMDLSDNFSAFEVLRESLRRAKVPVCSAAPVRWDGIGATLIDCIEGLLGLPAELPRLRQRAEAELATRYGSDTGWNQVWLAISMRNAFH